jgi:hypothetical protein
MTNNSVKIILNQYKQEHITEDEAIQLIEDLYSNNTIINNLPSYPWTTYPLITYDTKFPKYEITCNHDTK